LRPKPGNPPPPWFWGSTKKPTIGFEAKPGETVVASFDVKLEKIIPVVLRPNHWQTVTAGFEAKPLKTVAAGFEAKPSETITTSFEAKPQETVAASFDAKPLETVAIGFEA
jgi:hypothetical protein